MSYVVETLVASRAVALAYAVLVYAAMFGLAAVIVRSGAPRRLTDVTAGRIGSLDGLRGVLALGVFVHHSVIAYVWATTGVWDYGPNAVVNQLGQTTVALFFMITGFLFTLKTMRPFDWGDFVRSRLARLGPLYAAFVVAVFVIVFAVTRQLNEVPTTIAKELAMWLAFVCFGRPDVNGYPNTWIIVAGVNWSLKYEVLFYVFAVPVVYGINRMLPRWIALAVAVAAFVVLLAIHRSTGSAHGERLYGLHFIGGIVVAYLYAIPSTRTMLETRTVRWLGAAAACSLVFMLHSTSAKAIVASVLVFAAAAGNGSVFGLLRTRPAIWLGDVSYGIYLLHGIALWIGYRLVHVPMSLAAFFAFGLTIVTVAVLVASVSYVRFELPAMHAFRKSRAQSRTAAAASIAG